jgi:hypothetical protein
VSFTGATFAELAGISICALQEIIAKNDKKRKSDLIGSVMMLFFIKIKHLKLL